MKCCAIFLSAMAFFGGCSPNIDLADRLMESSLGEGKYSVTVVQDRGVTTSQAKAYAKKRAAELAWVNGDRYFIIESEGKVQVFRARREAGSDAPQNLYQELILERGFGRQEWSGASPPPSETYPAYRIVFQGYPKKPSWRAIDVCTLIDCRR